MKQLIVRMQSLAIKQGVLLGAEESAMLLSDREGDRDKRCRLYWL